MCTNYREATNKMVLAVVGMQPPTRNPNPCDDLIPEPREPNDHINMRIPQTMFSAIPLVLGLGTRMQDAYVSVAFGAPDHGGFVFRHVESHFRQHTFRLLPHQPTGSLAS